MFSAKDDLPKETSNYISGIQADSNRSAADLAHETLRGTNESANLLRDDGFDEGLGFSNDALKAAIQNKARGDYGREMNRLKTQTDFEAVNRKFDRLKNAAGLVAQEHQHNEQARLLRYQERQRKKALRGQIVGQVLGITGAVVGGVYGGPAGAGAGYMIGSGVGNTVGGQ